MADVSVIIPTKDRLRFLRRAIPMYLKYEEVREVIVIVDGSRDGTLEYLKIASAGDERVRYIDNGVNRGTPYSRNQGIAAARCGYIFSTEDDLEIVGDFFGTLLRHMERSGADVIAARNIFRAEDESADEAIARSDRIPGPAVDRRIIDVATGMAIDHDRQQLLIASPMLGAAGVFREIGFDERYEVNFWREESDFQLSAQERGYRVVSCPHALSFNFVINQDRGGAHSAVGMKRVIWVVRNNWRFIRKHRIFIEENFDIVNPYVYIAKFAVRRVAVEIVIPWLLGAKQRLLRTFPSP